MIFNILSVLAFAIETTRNGSWKARPNAITQRPTDAKPFPGWAGSPAADLQNGLPHDRARIEFAWGTITSESWMGQKSTMLGEYAQKSSVKVWYCNIKLFSNKFRIPFIYYRVQKLQDQLVVANEQRALHWKNRIGDFLSGKPTAPDENYEIWNQTIGARPTGNART